MIFCASAYTDLSRFLNPDGEKFMPGYYRGGQVDFSYPYLGARAWLAGLNPYVNNDPRFTHEPFGVTIIEGTPYKQLYPPGHLITYLPLALIYGADAVGAGRVMFHISLLCLFGLGFPIWRLLCKLRRESVSPFFLFAAVAPLMLYPGAQLGLERGQADMVTALMCWMAVVLLLRNAVAPALFLAVWASSFKGYPAVFTEGLLLFSLRPGTWRSALLGFFAGVALFVAPAWRFLREALTGTLFRGKAYYFPGAYNHSFKSFVSSAISQPLADPGRMVLALLALGVTILWGWHGWQRRRDLSSPSGVLTLILFATASLLLMIGVSVASISYNLILVLPGMLLLAVGQDQIVEMLHIGRVGAHVLGAAIVFCGFTLFLDAWYQRFPLASVGLVGLLVLLAVLGVKMPRPTPATPDG